uniref:Hypocretin neuropeptide precursor n=1 Tax=Sphaeramia orbicularis TaxID=375764 RepID=A0A673BIX9_9TELE
QVVVYMICVYIYTCTHYIYIYIHILQSFMSEFLIFHGLMLWCCSQPSRGTLTGDAAAGILTLGKRLEDEHRLQSRLHQLLHGSKNQAESDWTMQAGNTITTSLPV